MSFRRNQAPVRQQELESVFGCLKPSLCHKFNCLSWTIFVACLALIIIIPIRAIQVALHLQKILVVHFGPNRAFLEVFLY